MEATARNRSSTGAVDGAQQHPRRRAENPAPRASLGDFTGSPHATMRLLATLRSQEVSMTANDATQAPAALKPWSTMPVRMSKCRLAYRDIAKDYPRRRAWLTAAWPRMASDGMATATSHGSWPAFVALRQRSRRKWQAGSVPGLRLGASTAASSSRSGPSRVAEVGTMVSESDRGINLGHSSTTFKFGVQPGHVP